MLLKFTHTQLKCDTSSPIQIVVKKITHAISQALNFNELFNEKMKTNMMHTLTINFNWLYHNPKPLKTRYRLYTLNC